MSEVKRHDPMSFGIEGAFLSEHPEGDAVKYEDHYYAMQNKDAEIKRLQDLVSSSEQQRYTTCALLNEKILKLGRELQWIAGHAKDKTIPARHRLDDIAESASETIRERAGDL